MKSRGIQPAVYAAVRSGLGRFGLELRRARPTHDDFPRLAHFLRTRGVRTVLDVGANKGQFAKDLFAQGYQGSIISFEPIPRLHPVLNSEAEAFGGRWKIAPAVALSDRSGEETFCVSENLASSSLLTVLESSIEAAPGSAIAENITVKTEPLDAMYSNLGAIEPVFLKIDTQGAESAVLLGAAETLKSIVGVKIEMSLLPLYEGQYLAEGLDLLLRNSGFECWDLVPGFRNRETGRLLQYDGVYFRGESGV